MGERILGKDEIWVRFPAEALTFLFLLMDLFIQ